MGTLEQIATSITDPRKRRAFQRLYAPSTRPEDLKTRADAAHAELVAALEKLKATTKPATLADKAEQVLRGLPGTGDGAGGKRHIPCPDRS